eukprot:CAMPEP_0179154018 /NCGR_PEP_ID=MMETSP0796-20121207/74931_1 /TAXON_ID=73915 /ORGANISM="Pyrodinium bahamense, Strain pbaha01" /LENGTH=216 /DNA_ID=CAMNT_0020855351 /DNA_START=35 /DNA_END=686 /DNA_ORIENTATION=-
MDPREVLVRGLLGHCDVVTDFGTIEHVGEGEGFAALIAGSADSKVATLAARQAALAAVGVRASLPLEAQYEVFRNMHELARPDGGLMVHALPLAGCWPGHGAFEYEQSFFWALADAAGYEVADVTLYRPSHSWAPGEEQTFWTLLHQAFPALAQLGPKHAPEVPDTKQEALVLAALVRRGPGAFLDAHRFVQLPGIRPKVPAPCPGLEVARSSRDP